jgi:hypothetical protein
MRVCVCVRAGIGLKIQEDTTHGLEQHGGQVHVYATSDAQHIGRRFGTCIMPRKGSTTELYTKVHQTYSDAFQAVAAHLTPVGLPVRLLQPAASHMSDAADELPNSCAIVHPGVLKVVCSKHLLAGVDKHEGLFTSPEQREHFVPFIKWLVKCPHTTLLLWAKKLLEDELREAGQIDFLAWWSSEYGWRNFTHAEVPWGEPITNNCVEVFNRYLKQSLGRQMKHWTNLMQLLLEQMRIESMKQGAHQHLPAIGANCTETKRVWEAAQQLYASFARRPLSFRFRPPLTVALPPFFAQGRDGRAWPHPRNDARRRERAPHAVRVSHH